MPELPEVETTRRGIAPHLEGQRVSRVIVRERRLRWPIPEDLDVRLSGQRIVLVERRAKYLLINAEVGTLISHLGMSGNLRLVEAGLPAAKHEHVDIELESGLALRYTDPRRFGAMLWSLDPLNEFETAVIGADWRSHAGVFNGAGNACPQAHLFYALFWQFTNKARSEEHTSELQSRRRISYAVFCLKKKNFFNDTATTEIYTLSLHDALPIF